MSNEDTKNNEKPSSKRFLYRERYIDIYIYTFVFLHVRPCVFFTCHCSTCEKSRFNDKVSLRQVLCSILSKKKEEECKNIVCNSLDLLTLEN